MPHANHVLICHPADSYLCNTALGTAGSIDEEGFGHLLGKAIAIGWDLSLN